jgi:hypothetical protein
MTAFGADGVRQSHFTTIAALHQVARFQRVVRASAIASALADFSLW